MSDKQTIRRIILCFVMLLAAMTGLGFRLAFLHLGPHDQERTSIGKTRRYECEILAGRGNIYDARGRNNLLAMNLAVKDVCVDPKKVADECAVKEVTVALADLLDVEADTLAVRLNNRPDRRFEYVKRYVHENVADLVRQKNLPGIFFEDATVRHYPHRTFMCHVLGFVNYEGIGSAGIEQRADRYLRGSPGFMQSRVNALRQELYGKREQYIPALKGGDIILTLDQNIQYSVEKSLDEAMHEHNAVGAFAIVQRVHTGEILAMASRPTYDLNEFSSSDNHTRLNRAIGSVYEPGSTLKAVTFAAALNEGHVTPDTVIDCENGAWVYGKRLLRDYHGYGNLTVADGIKKSSNIMAAKLALSIGEQKFYDYLKAFGLGSRLGLDLPGEEKGILHSVNKWSAISATRMAMGQGVSVTGIQMLSVFSAIANGGYLMKPYVVKEIVGPDGQVIHKNEPQVISRPLLPETAATMRWMLSRVTESGGTGRRGGVDGYQVAGKTGTAQKPVAGGYSDTDHIASFVGFLPAADPEIAVIVVVDNPQPLHTGGRVSAPVFSKIAGAAVRYLDIEPSSRLAIDCLKEHGRRVGRKNPPSAGRGNEV